MGSDNLIDHGFRSTAERAERAEKRFFAKKTSARFARSAVDLKKYL
jgi:hypothetical protein